MLALYGLVIRTGPVGIAREYGEVIVGCVLNQRVIPAVSDQGTFQGDVVRSAYVLGVLLQEVIVEDRGVMAPVAFGCEKDSVSCILWERPHEALECFPHVRCRCGGAVGGQRLVEVRVGTAIPVAGVVGASVVRQLDQVARVGVNVCGNRDRVTLADLSGLVNEDHVGDIRP